MDVIRRVVVLGSLLAVVFGSWGLAKPIRVSPEIGIGDMRFNIPRAEAATVACGSVVAPRTPSGGDGLREVVSGLGSALIGQGCPRALRQQARESSTWIGGGLVTLLLGSLILRTPRSAAQRTADRSVLVPAGSYGGVESAPVDALRPRRGRRTAVAALGALAVVSVLTYVSRQIETSGESTSGSRSVEVSAGTATERACIERTRQSDDRLRAEADLQAEADEKAAVLNLDGAAAYADYAQALSLLDVSECPEAFQTAFAQWSLTWRAYGEYAREASKFHAPWNAEWSEEAIADRQEEFTATIEQADDGLAAASDAVGGDWSSRSWSGG